MGLLIKLRKMHMQTLYRKFTKSHDVKLKIMAKYKNNSSAALRIFYCTSFFSRLLEKWHFHE